jgi:hypothetical protein
MSKQPEALRLADDLDQWSHTTLDVHEAAAELRRLHEVNGELLFALKNLLRAKNGESAVFDSDEIARAAIAKAEGEKA